MIANQANVVIDESHLLHVCNNGIDSENHKIGDTREGLPVFSPQLQELTHQHAPPRFSDEENLGDNLDESQLTIQDFNFSALSNMETDQSDLSPMIDHSLHPPLDNTEPSEMSRLMTSELRLASAQTDLEPGSATTASVAATMPVLMFTNQVDGRVGEAQLLHVCNNAVDTENQKIGETTEVSSKKSMPASPAPLEGLAHQHALDFGGENSGSVLDGSTFRSCQAINDLSLSTLSSVEPVQCDLSQNLVLPLPKVGDVQSSLDISDSMLFSILSMRPRFRAAALAVLRSNTLRLFHSVLITFPSLAMVSTKKDGSPFPCAQKSCTYNNGWILEGSRVVQ